ESVLEFHSAAGMIDMAMREPDCLNGNAVLLDSGADTIDFATRIDDDSHLFGFIEEDGAILLERRDGNDARSHFTHGDLPCRFAVLFRTGGACKSTGTPREFPVE